MVGRARWILPLGSVLAASAAGLWIHLATPRVSSPAEQPAPRVADEELERLRSLGYVDFAEKADGSPSGVIRRDRAASWPGYNLYTNVHFCSAVLMDEAGSTKNFWAADDACDRWANVELLPDGDLLVVGRDLGASGQGRGRRYLMRLDWKGARRWKRHLPSHHDIEQIPSGALLALTLATRSVELAGRPVEIVDNRLTLFSGDGNEQESVSLFDLFGASEGVVGKWRPEASGSGPIDVFHANSVEWVRPSRRTGTHPLYAPSSVLVCLRHLNAIVVVDWSAKRIVWAWGRNELDGPHDATLLPTGNILVFDNGLERGWSRVLELDPLTRQIVWQYRAREPSGFFTSARGSNQRLPGGTTLVAESGTGRAFEVTPEGRIVWEFRNPFTDAQGRRAAIARLYRLERSFVDQLVARRGEGVRTIPRERMISSRKSAGDDGY